jgi:hypothetical protein
LQLVVCWIGLIVFWRWSDAPLVNFREDQFATHALVFSRRLHGAALVALDHRLVTGCATSVAFVNLDHRSINVGCFGMCSWMVAFQRLAGWPALPQVEVRPHPQKLCAELGITHEHLCQTRMPIGFAKTA